jgi:hypothetical protein
MKNFVAGTKEESLSRGASPERLVKFLALAKYRFADG